MKFLAVLLLVMVPQIVFADWYVGKVDHIGVGYDGTTITVKLEGWARSDCSCYPTWGTYMCLDKNRDSHDYEKALILAARARGSVIKINIEEASCKVIAMYEDNN